MLEDPAPATATGAVTDEQGDLARCFIELLKDDQLLSALKKALFPVDLSNKLDMLNATIERLSRQIEER